MLHKGNSANKVPAFWYIKMDDKMEWFDFIRASIDDFMKKHDYFPVFITMNPTDRLKVIGKSRGIKYHKTKISINEDKKMLHLNIGLHY